MFKGFWRTRKPKSGEILKNYRKFNIYFFVLLFFGKAYPLCYSIMHVKTHLKEKIGLRYWKLR